jgi:DNA-binding response OmpR family regulator
MVLKNKPKILIFEDDDYAVDIYVTKFAASGFNVKVFLDYDNVIERTIKEKPEAICCDIMMPTPDDGYEAIKLLVTDNRTKDIPIIILSNLDREQDRIHRFENGIKGYFVKTNHTPAEVVGAVKEQLFKSGKFTEKDFTDTTNA